MKIVLANLSGVQQLPGGGIRHLAKAGSRWPMTIGHTRHVDYYPFPFSLAYATALLKGAPGGFEVRGLDGVARDDDEESLLRELDRERPDILVAEVTLITLKSDLAFLRKARERFSCRVIVVGVYPSVFQEKVVEDAPWIDWAIYGEYELSLKELAAGLLRQASPAELRGISGLIFKDGNRVIKHPQRAAVSDLNRLPFPDRTDFPVAMYADFAMRFPCASILASRGCPAGCVYCVERHVTYASPRYRMRDPVSVVDEMEHCHRALGAKQFYFDDQSFVVNRAYVARLCEEMLSRRINVPWTCMGDAMFLDFATLERMAGAGCIGMKFGVESANEEILRRIRKPLKLDKVREVARWCRRLGIMSHATFCIGLPGETPETIRQTCRFIRELDVDSAQVSRAVAYPGTPFYEWARDSGYLVTDDLDRYDGMASSVLSYPGLPAGEIDAWYERISRMVSRRKLWHYLKHPAASLAILGYMLRHQGIVRLIGSLGTFLRRSC